MQENFLKVQEGRRQVLRRTSMVVIRGRDSTGLEGTDGGQCLQWKKVGTGQFQKRNLTISGFCPISCQNVCLGKQDEPMSVPIRRLLLRVMTEEYSLFEESLLGSCGTLLSPLPGRTVLRGGTEERTKREAA